MTPATARKMHWTEEEYVLLEAQSSIKHEYLDGEIFAMAGAKPDHNQVAAAVLGALVALIRGGRCRAFNSDQRIFVAGTGLYTYADGGVACGRWEIHSDGMCLLNPVLLYEVLSPSTRDYDRGAKLEHYQTIPSLKHVLLIGLSERVVEHHHRDGDDAWTVARVHEGEAPLPELGGALTLADIYLPPEG